jgi:hypothetical protein
VVLSQEVVQQDQGSEEDLSEEEEGKIDPIQSTKKTSKRGIKSAKEHGDVETYKDKLQGGQSTLEGMINPRTTRQQGQFQKGMNTTKKGK